MSPAEERFYNTISDILSIGGGILGAGGGSVAPGPGNLAGGLLGAGLGKGAGESIKQFAKRMQGQEADNLEVLKAIPEGAAQEMGGQILGKTAGAIASKAIDKIKPTSNEVQELIKGLRKTEDGTPTLEYHGSYVDIPNPKADAKTGVLGNEVFFTTENKPLANMFAEYKLIKESPFPDLQSPVVNEYYSREGVPTIKVDRLNLYEIGERIGLTPKQVDAALKYSQEYSGNPLGRVYTEMIRELGATQKPPVPIREAGQLAADKLKSQGIEKIIKQIDIGGEEIGHFYPERNLFYKPDMDRKLKEELLNKDINRKAKTIAQSLIESLRGPVSRQGDSKDE